MDTDNYIRTYEHRAVKLSFTTAGVIYDGDGTVAWDPDRGARIKAQVQPRDPAAEPATQGPIVVDTDWVKIDGILDFGDTFQMEVPHLDELLLDFGRIDVRAPSIAFERALTGTKNEEGSRRAFALVDFGDALALPHLPDRVTHEISVGGHRFPARIPAAASRGLREERPDGYVAMAWPASDARSLWLTVSLPTSQFTDGEALAWVRNAGEAFAWLSGQDARSIYVEQISQGTLRRHYRCRERVAALSPYLPVGGKDSKIDRDTLLKLLDFLARESKERKIAREMYTQLVDASQQKGVVGRDLLMASILEAMLRNVYEKPFVGQKGKDSFDIEQCIADFSGKRLGPSFRSVRKEALAAFRRLRDRAAHPDWGLLNWRTSEEAQQALSDRVLLARYYYSVILAFAGATPSPDDTAEPTT